MKEIYLTRQGNGISEDELYHAVEKTVEQYPSAKKVLIIPPDFTRCFSCAGDITRYLYRLFTERGAHVDVMPGLGTHVPLSDEERIRFFKGEVPASAILLHRWQTDCVKLGIIPASILEEISGGVYGADVPVEVDYRLTEGGYDVIFCPGQVVPHEAAGMSGYSKSLFIGVGGREMINQAHMLAAVCGCEQAMGVMNSPLRRMFDYAQEHFVSGKIPVVFLLTVTTLEKEAVHLNGLYIGDSRIPYEKACKLSGKVNITHVDRPAKKVVAYMEPDEFRSVWLCNKAIYRTRMIVEDGGELLIVAPGVTQIGESNDVDKTLRRFGYRGRKQILEWYRQGLFGEDILSAGILIIGSSDGRFKITYATVPQKMSGQEIRDVGYDWIDCDEVLQKYNPSELKEGWNVMPDGEEIYFVGKPALGLWKLL